MASCYRKEKSNFKDDNNYLTKPAADVTYVNEPISEDISMNNHKITNCSQGSEKDDVCTIKNLEEKYTIGTVLDMQYKQITNLANCTEIMHAVNHNQVNNLIQQSADLTNNMNSNKITNLARGTESTDGVNYSQLSDLIETFDDYILKTQHNNMGGAKITNVGNGEVDTDACTVGQVVSRMAGCVYKLNGRLNNTLANGLYAIIRFSQNITDSQLIIQPAFYIIRVYQ